MSAYIRTVTITIPDTLRFWPWPRHCNPNYPICKDASARWCESFKAFTPSAQKAFNKCDFNLLASLAFPLLDLDGCRVGCDLMNLFFVIDEHTDLANIETARIQAGIIMDALCNPHKPREAQEWVGGRVAQEFWTSAIKKAKNSAQCRFIDAFHLYMASVVQQATDRSHNHIREINDYFEVRRDTIGAKPSFAINELYLNLPNAVHNHPVVKKLTALTIDMLIIGNDLCSYKIEHERGDDMHNLVTVVMRQFNTDIQAAINWIGDLHDRIAKEFLDEWKNIPTYGGPLDLEVRTYCYGLGNWVRANDSWSFESERYFGKQGVQIQKSRKITLTQPIVH